MPRYLLEDEENKPARRHFEDEEGKPMRRRDAKNYKSSREDVADVLKTFFYRMFFLIFVLSGILLAFAFRNEINSTVFNPPPQDQVDMEVELLKLRKEVELLEKEREATKETDTEQTAVLKLVLARQADRDHPLTAYSRNMIRKHWRLITNGMPNEEISRLMEILDMRYNDEGDVVDLTSREIAYLKTIRQTPTEKNDRDMLEKLRESIMTFIRDGEKKDRQIADLKQIIQYPDDKFQMLGLLRKCLKDKSFFPTDEERALMRKNWSMVTDWIDKTEAMHIMTRLGMARDEDGEIIIIPREKFENWQGLEKKKAEAEAVTEEAGNAGSGKSENPAAGASPVQESGENPENPSPAEAEVAVRNSGAGISSSPKPAESGDQVIYNLLYADQEKNGNGKKTENRPLSDADAVFSALIADQSWRVSDEETSSVGTSEKNTAAVKTENASSRVRDDDSAYIEDILSVTERYEEE